MTLFELSDLLDFAVSRYDTIHSWNYIDLLDDDAQVDVETVRGVIRVHVFLDTSFVGFLRTETHFVRVTTPEDFKKALVSLS